MTLAEAAHRHAEAPGFPGGELWVGGVERWTRRDVTFVCISDSPILQYAPVWAQRR